MVDGVNSKGQVNKIYLTDNAELSANAVDEMQNSVFENSEIGENEVTFSEKSLDDSKVEELENRLNSVKDEQGVISSIWNKVKCATNIGCSTEKCEKAIENYKNGEISYDEALEQINKFETKQKNSVNMAANILTGVAAVAVVGSAIATGGLSLGVVAAAAGVGAATKTGLKFADRATNKVKGDALDAKQITKDALSGAVDGAISVATMGMGTAAVTSETIASQTLKDVVIQGVKSGAKAGAISGAVTGASDYTIEAAIEEDVDFNVKDLAKTTITTAAGGALVGGAIGGVASGVQYNKVTAEVKADISGKTDDIYANGETHINEAKGQVEDQFGNMDSAAKITARTKSKDSISYKIFKKFKKGKIDDLTPENCTNAIADLYGTRIQLTSITSEQADDVIAAAVRDTSFTPEQVVKYISGDALDLDEPANDALSIVAKDVVEKLKTMQTQEVVDNLIDGIKASKINLTELNNYGDEMSSYFTTDQIRQIADAYYDTTGKPLNIVHKDLLESHPNIDVDELGKASYSKITPENSVKSSGYSTSQMNVEHEFADGSKGLGELQIRGEKLNQFADAEHIPYDIRTGKITASNAKYSDVYKTITSMSEESYNAYNQYLTDVYRYYRMSELGMDVAKPSIPTNLTTKSGQAIPVSKIQMLSSDSLITIKAKS